MLQTINRFSEPYLFPRESNSLLVYKYFSELFFQKKEYSKPQDKLFFENQIFCSRESGHPVWNIHVHDIQTHTPSIDGLSKKITSDINKEYIEIKLSNKTFQLPFAFKDLKAEIDASKYILELEEGWGEDGEKYDIHVWERVVEFIINMYLTSESKFGVIPDLPKIYHGPDGTIDIVWEKSNYQILANCPKEENRQVSFYGENIRKDSFKGSFYITDSCHSLLMILIGIKICGI